MATIVVKSYLEMPDLSIETRRITIEQATIDANGIYDQVHGKVGHAFPDLKAKKFSLFWKDEDDDFVTMSTDEEIRDLLSNEVNGMCKIYIKVCGDVQEETKAMGRDQSSVAVDEENHNKSDVWVTMTPNHPPPHYGAFPAHPPPPPPPFLGFHHHRPFGPFGGPWGMRRGGGHHQHHHGFGHHQHHHGFGHHQHHHGFGHHQHHHGFGHHFPHHGAGRHHPHGNHHWGHHWGMHGHKENLRTLVPMPHRRWAKGYIQSWRKENLKNATTTTTDSDNNFDWKISMVDANVPEAYVTWLEMKLLRWHKKCGANEEGDLGDGNESDKKDKKANKALKASVPKEFRKWTKWYLNTHCGRRDAPRFKQHHFGSGWNEELGNKRHTLSAPVPREYRISTKKFIKNWRIEMKLDDPKSAQPSREEDDEDCKADIDDSERFSIPEEYKQWLEKFLLRWHVWRGQLERRPGITMRGGMGQFKDTVPMEYRTWVKHFMAVHYSKHKKSERCSKVEADPSQKKYDVFLQAFQKKWMEDNDNLMCMSSSEEEAYKGEPESSFERLSINNENGCKKSKVRFDDQSDKAKKQKTLKKMEDADFLMLDSDDLDDSDDDMTTQRNVRMDPNFRRWTKQALYEWDGQTVNNGNNIQQDGHDDVQLPPNVYRWMSKMMMRMQMKKMKQQIKAAKHEIKAAKKQQKD